MAEWCITGGMPSGEPSCGGLAAELWARCKPEAMQSLEHPFVTALGCGDLPQQLFADYIAQDVFYLDAFARAYTAAIDKAPAPEVAQTLTELRAGVLEEVKLHAGYAGSLGVSKEAMQTPNPATLAYTQFLLSTAEQLDVLHILAAMTPCSRLYGFLGCRLAAAHPGHQHAFSDWIATYSGDAYLQLPDRKERLLNALAAGRDFEELLRLYRTAMELELRFFDAHNPERLQSGA